MRLGELKSKTRNCDGRQIVALSDYKDGTVKRLEIDMANRNYLFLRVVDEE